MMRALALKTAIACMVVATAACSLAIDTSGLSNGQDLPVTNDAGTDAATVIGNEDAASNDGGPTITSDPTILSAGARHTCALHGGTIRCWGSNSAGQLGDGSTEQRNAPVNVVGLPGKASAVSAGDARTCAIVDAKLYCWGSNDGGALGKGATGNSKTPVLVPDLPSPVTMVSTASDFTCAVAASRAYCWGGNAAGQLGDGTSGAGHTAASAVIDANGIVEDVERVSASGDHACLLTKTKTVMCWGHHDNQCALGNPSVTDGSSTAVPVVGLPGPASDMFMAGWHGCALVDGGVWCWGRNDNGELGNGKRTHSVAPVQPIGLGSKVTAVFGAGGNDTSDATCAYQGTELLCWGAGSSGRLGYGATSERDTPTKVQSSGFPQVPVVSISGGFDHFCAAFATGEVRCWGAGKDGQLGDGLGQDSLVPVSLPSGN